MSKSTIGKNELAIAIAEKLGSSKEEAKSYRGCYSLNRTIYKECCTPRTLILHPLPRDQRANEIDVDLNDHPSLGIFKQAANGIPIRMALFAMILDVVKKFDLESKSTSL
jgi:aspartate carbamoyltransferase catalytic subunit